MTDTYDSGYAASRERFERDTAKHELQVLHDDGLYRHLRFSAPDTYCYGYDLVTWPGYLVICGDMGDYTFTRIRDMFEFFAGERQAPGINPSYWAQKLCGDRGGRDIARRYSEDTFRARVIEWFIGETGLQLDGTIAQWALDSEAPGELMHPWTLGQALALSRALDEDVLRGACEHDVNHEHGAHAALRAFEFPSRDDVPYNAPQGLTVDDSWEWDLRDFDGSFLWACWAIRRGIEHYRAATTEPAKAAA